MDFFEKDKNYTDHIILVIIGVIFFLVFIIQMTIFDFYKRPSIYEIELFNEFKKRNCGSVGAKCSDSCGCSGSDKHKKENYNFYKDIVFFILYVNVMYVLSLYLSEMYMMISAIVFTLSMLVTKQSYLTKIFL